MLVSALEVSERLLTSGAGLQTLELEQLAELEQLEQLERQVPPPPPDLLLSVCVMPWMEEWAE